MPKPDCVYETIEDLAEEIVENYGRHTSSNDDDDTEEDDCTGKVRGFRPFSTRTSFYQIPNPNYKELIVELEIF